MAALSRRDLRILIDVVGSIGYEPEADALSPELLSALLELVDSTWVDYVVWPTPLSDYYVMARSVSAPGAEWVDEGPWRDVFWDLTAATRSSPRPGSGFV